MALISKKTRLAGIGIVAASAIAFIGLAPASATESTSEKTHKDQKHESKNHKEEKHKEEKPETTVEHKKKDSESKRVAIEVKFEADKTCVLTIKNQQSVHPGNHIEITTNGKTHVLEEVEGEANKITTKEITFGGETKAELILGPSGISSLAEQDISCPEPAAKPVPAQPNYTG